MQMVVFWVSHAIVLAAWLMLFARRSKGVTFSRKLGAMLAIAYSIIFLISLEPAGILVRQYNLAGIASFFSYPNLALAGWIHYLVFDLWVGIWEVEEAERIGMSSLPLSICLFLTFLAGPIGLAVFLAAQFFVKRKSDTP